MLAATGKPPLVGMAPFWQEHVKDDEGESTPLVTLQKDQGPHLDAQAVGEHAAKDGPHTKLGRGWVGKESDATRVKGLPHTSSVAKADKLVKTPEDSELRLLLLR